MRRARPSEYASSEDHEEENYFISLSDLMTGVVFIFVILLVTFAYNYRLGQQELERARAEAKAAATRFEEQEKKARAAEEDAARSKRAADLTNALLKDKEKEIDKLAALLRAREEYRKTLLEKLVQRLHEQHVQVELDHENGIIRLPEELLFRQGEATLRESGRAALAIIAHELKGTLADWCAPDVPYRLEALFVEGHTDRQPIRTDPLQGNWKLSTARAVNTLRELLQAEPVLESFRSRRGQPMFGASGYAETRPIKAGDTPQDYDLNRRIDLRFLVDYPVDLVEGRKAESNSPLPTER